MTEKNRINSRRWILKWKRRRTEPWMVKLHPYQRDMLRIMGPKLGYWRLVRFSELLRNQTGEEL